MQVKFAHDWNLPFLTYDGTHGAMTTLGNMQYGIEILMRGMSSVEVSDDGKTARIGGGTISKTVTDELWAAGKQTVTGTCECVSYMGPALGGGHGWLQGHHGLIADQIETMNVVLAGGHLKTLDRDSALMWAMKGAGHNFGVVTSVTAKVYDIRHPNWAIETLTFSGDKVEAVYQAANDHLVRDGRQPTDVVNWSYWLNHPEQDPENPVIVFYILQEAVDAVDPVYTKPFRDIGPVSIEAHAGTYKDLPAWTLVAKSSPPCQKDGFAHPRFPIYLQSYDPTAQKEAYDLFAAKAGPSSHFNISIFMFEGYANQGVRDVDADSTAFAFRGDNLLCSPLISYEQANNPERIAEAAELGNRLRHILWKGSGRDELHAYVNYAYGDETPQEWYGHEDWRQAQLGQLKSKYDPNDVFSFFGPIPQGNN